MRPLNPKNFPKDTVMKVEPEVEASEPIPPELMGKRYPTLNSREFLDFMSQVDPGSVRVQISSPKIPDQWAPK